MLSSIKVREVRDWSVIDNPARFQQASVPYSVFGFLVQESVKSVILDWPKKKYNQAIWLLGNRHSLSVQKNTGDG